ncbi:hypothetical protein IAU60_005392 [Kwoniella sp. DSM 27419]
MDKLTQSTQSLSTTSPSSHPSSTPLTSTVASTPTRTSSITPKTKLATLKEEAARLRAKLGSRDPDQVIKRHIELLHTYNEIKDGTQALIGRYAAMDGKTVREIHVELELPLYD